MSQSRFQFSLLAMLLIVVVASLWFASFRTNGVSSTAFVTLATALGLIVYVAACMAAARGYVFTAGIALGFAIALCGTFLTYQMDQGGSIRETLKHYVTTGLVVGFTCDLIAWAFYGVKRTSR